MAWLWWHWSQIIQKFCKTKRCNNKCKIKTYVLKYTSTRFILFITKRKRWRFTRNSVKNASMINLDQRVDNNVLDWEFLWFLKKFVIWWKISSDTCLNSDCSCRSNLTSRMLRCNSLFVVITRVTSHVCTIPTKSAITPSISFATTSRCSTGIITLAYRLEQVRTVFTRLRIPWSISWSARYTRWLACTLLRSTICFASSLEYCEYCDHLRRKRALWSAKKNRTTKIDPLHT